MATAILYYKKKLQERVMFTIGQINQDDKAASELGNATV